VQNVESNRRFEVGFKLLTAVVMNGYVFWDVASCRTLKVTDVSKYLASYSGGHEWLCLLECSVVHNVESNRRFEVFSFSQR
jgi:hypothetical protein